MRFLACTALLIAFIIRPPVHSVAYAASHRGVAVIGTESVATQGSAEGRPGESLISKASAQTGSTSDVQINNAITSLAHRSGIVWADYSANQTWATCPNWGAQSITLVLYPVTYTIATNCTIPANVSLQFFHGACLAPADGTTTTITGYFTAPMSKIFCNAVAGHGTIRLASGDKSDEGGQALVHVYPEWWGASAGDASGTVNTPALQAAIIGAYGNNRTSATPYPKYNRVLHFSALYNINAELHVYHMIGFRWEGENQFGGGVRQRTCGLRIIDGQSIAYGRFESLHFENGCGGKSGAALVDIDYSRAQGVDLAPQNITFYDDFFAGAGLTDVGVLIAKSGGGAQGDNIRCYNCYFNGFTGAGWQIGGNNTGRNAGRYYAQNAIKEQIIGGDCQGNPLYCIAVYGGSIEVNGMSMENDSGGFGTQIGPDVYCEAPQDACVMENVRSESHILIWSNPLIVVNSRTIFQAPQWYNGSSCLTGTTLPVGSLFSGTGSGGDGAYYKVTANTSAFGGLCKTAATGGSSTTITVAGTPWTTNAFVGYRTTLWSGMSAGCYGIITSNTTNKITFSAGLITSYYQLPCKAPDATTFFVVEPNWGTQKTSGGMTWTAFPFDVIAGGLGTPVTIGSGRIQDVNVSGGQIRIGGGTMKNVIVSRSDWLDSRGGTFPLDSQFVTFHVDNVTVFRPGKLANQQLSWSFPRQGYVQQKKGNVSQFGTEPICWGSGNANNSAAVGDVCFYPIAQPFSNLPACNSITEGYQATITDSATSTYGNTITGGGKNHVHGYCNGANWVVD